jgi:hypothetical protein
MRRTPSILSAWASVAVISLGFPPAVAAAAETTITFDNLPAYTRVTNQYPGIFFASPSEFGFTLGKPAKGATGDYCGAPTIEETPATHSPPKAAAIYCGGQEFGPAGTFAALTDYANKVSAYVGNPYETGEAFRLEAYDIERNLIGSVEVKALGPGINTPVSFEAPSYEIAYFALYATNAVGGPSAIGVDDLSFTSGEAAPAISLLAGVGGGRFAQGAQVERAVSLIRHNGSEGEVELRATGLPSGVSASFKPQVLTGTETASTLTLNVAANAPLGATTGFLEADPKTVKAGSAVSTVPVDVAVVPPFSVWASTPVTVPPCSSAGTLVRTTTGQGFSGPVDLALTTGGQTSDLASLALGKSALAPAEFWNLGFGFGGLNEQTLSIARNGNGPATGSFQVFVTGTSGSLSEPTATVDVQRGPPIVRLIAPSSGRTPQALQPGTPVTIYGEGFCPGTTVQFGNPGQPPTPDWKPTATATASFVNSSGTVLTVNVPPLAYRGPVTVTSAGASATAPAQVTIDNYRDVNGYSFHNIGHPNITFARLAEAFGHWQTYITINPCVIFDCSFDVRNPWAIVIQWIAEATIGGAHGGDCWGFSLSSQRFLEGVRSIAEFDGAATNIFGLPETEALENYLTAQQLTLLSNEVLGRWLAATTVHVTEGPFFGSLAVQSEVEDALRRGEHPIIFLVSGSDAHAVVAYNVEEAGFDDYYIDGYDSNAPAGAGEYPFSQIHVSGGNWSLPSTEINGGIGGIVVEDPGSVPIQPTLIGPGVLETALSDLGGILFGSSGPPSASGTGRGAPPSRVSQVEDAAHHTLFDAGGNLNTDPKTRLAGAPFVPPVGSGGLAPTTHGQPQMVLLPPHAGTLRATVEGTGGGSDTHTLLGHGVIGEIDTQASKGVKDTLTLTPGAGEVGFSTQAQRKPLRLTLTAVVAKESRVAAISTTSFGGRGDSMAFTRAQRAVTLTHHGGATTFSVVLSAVGPRTLPVVFKSGPLRIGAGATARLEDIHWGALGRSAVRVRIGGRTFLLHNHARSAHSASIATLRARIHHGRASVTIVRTRRRLPAGSTLAFSWMVRTGGHVVAAHSVEQSAGTYSATYKFKPKRKGRYEVTGTVTVITINGVMQNTSQRSRNVVFTI